MARAGHWGKEEGAGAEMLRRLKRWAAVEGRGKGGIQDDPQVSGCLMSFIELRKYGLAGCSRGIKSSNLAKQINNKVFQQGIVQETMFNIS